MKQKGISLSTLRAHNTRFMLNDDAIGEDHVGTSANTPLRPDAFDMSNEDKKAVIASHFRAIMETLGLDLTDDSLKGTPDRVAKMYVEEIFSGLDPANRPAATLFENAYNYEGMLVEKDISFFSNCEHHFVPIYGRAHVAYFSSGKVIGLSKLNRIVQYFAKRPQVQERLTIQIANELAEVLETPSVAVLIDARHMCVSSRGVNDISSSTVTSYFGGAFEDEHVREEFLRYVSLSKGNDGK